LRVARGLTQGDLAGKVEVSPQHIGALERGHVKLSDAMARKIASALGFEVSRVVASFERVRNRPSDVLP
jgi:DNA-binding XRE family transcriptional regulator